MACTTIAFPWGGLTQTFLSLYIATGFSVLLPWNSLDSMGRFDCGIGLLVGISASIAGAVLLERQRRTMFVDSESVHVLAAQRELLLDAGRRLNETLDLQDLERTIAALACSLLTVDTAALSTFEPDAQRLRLAASATPTHVVHGLDSWSEMPPDHPFRQALSFRAVLDIPSDDPQHPFRDLRPDRTLSRTLFVAIRRDGVLLGVLTFMRTGTAMFDEKQYRLACGIAELAAVALTNARLVDALQTTNRDLESALERAEHSDRIAEERKRLAELQARFVAMASHEFRTPLATIQATIEVLKGYEARMNADDRQKRYEKVLGQVRHLTLLIEDVLVLGKADAGRLSFHPEPIDLPSVCQQIVEHVQDTVDRATELVTRLAHAPSDTIMDPRLLQQILGNLLGNACKYSPGGGRIELNVEAEGPLVRFQVRDHGIGIAPEDQASLFEAFHRGGNVGKIEGSGLGLAVTQRAVELHGGTISVASEIGRGTTFTVRLPRTSSPPAVTLSGRDV